METTVVELMRWRSLPQRALNQKDCLSFCTNGASLYKPIDFLSHFEGFCRFLKDFLMQKKSQVSDSRLYWSLITFHPKCSVNLYFRGKKRRETNQATNHTGITTSSSKWSDTLHRLFSQVVWKICQNCKVLRSAQVWRRSTPLKEW